MAEKKTISRDERLFNIGWDAALEFTEASREERELKLCEFIKINYGPHFGFNHVEALAEFNRKNK